MNKIYKTGISEHYVTHWDTTAAIRELLVNALDSPAAFEYSFGVDNIEFISKGVQLPGSVLAMGVSSNRSNSDAVGCWGEGLLISMVILTREKVNVEIENGNVIWTPKYLWDEGYEVETLCIVETDNPNNNSDYIVKISGLDTATIEEVKKLSLYLFDEGLEEVGSCPDGTVYKTPEGEDSKLYVGGVLVKEIGNFEYTYDFHPSVLPMNRDRTSVDGWDLAKQTTLLVQKCIPVMEVFNLMSSGSTDISGYRYSWQVSAPIEIEDESYEIAKNRFGDDVILSSDWSEQELLQKNYKNVVTVSQEMYNVVKGSSEYQKALDELYIECEEEEDERSPLEVLWDFHKELSGYTAIYGDQLEEILYLFEEKGLTYG